MIFLKKEIIKSLKLELSQGEKLICVFDYYRFYIKIKDKSLLKIAPSQCKGVKAKFYKEIDGIDFDNFVTSKKNRFLGTKFIFSKTDNEKLFCQLDDYYDLISL